MKYQLLAIATMLSFNGFAQFFDIFDCSPALKVTSDYAVLVQQDYVLHDSTGQKFGRNGENFYGRRYGPGFIINEHLIFSRYTYNISDLDSLKLSISESLTPFPGQTSFKHQGSNNFISIAGDPKEIPDCSVVGFSIDTLDSYPEFSSVQLEDTMQCVLVFYESLSDDSTDFNPNNLNLNYSFLKVFKKKTKLSIANDNIGDNVLFGYLFFQFVSTGTVSYRFLGFLEKIEGAWKVTDYLPLTKIEDKGHRKRKK